MLPHQLALRLQSKIEAIEHAAGEAATTARDLERLTHPDAGAWLPAIQDALQRVRLECADLRFTAAQLRDALPSSESLQTRLL